MPEKFSLLRQVLDACRAELAGVTVFSFFVNLLMLTMPLYVLQVYGRVIVSRSFDTLLYLTIAALMAFVVLGILYTMRTRLLTRIGQKLDLLFGERVLSALVERAAGAQGNANSQGLRDVATLRGLLGGNDMTVLLDAPWTPIFLFAIYMFHPLLGAIGIAGALLLLTLAFLNEFTTRKHLAAANASTVAAHAAVEANLRNAEVVQAMGMRRPLLDRWAADNDEIVRAQSQASDRTAVFSSTSRAARMAIQILMMGAAAYLILEQTMFSMGMVIVPVLLLARALSPIEQAIGTWKNLVNARTAYRRLTRLLNANPPRPPAMRLPAPSGRLSVERLVLGVPNARKPILKGVNFALPAGESLGIIGPSAAGKTTLAKAIVGVWRPTAGEVRLDGADVAAWDREDLGRHLGYLPQDVELFDGTVRENIARLAAAEPDAVVAAARLAGVHDLILHLPDGYDTVLGRGGMVLSGGLRQRIALARALFGSPRLVVLDEPNANLDADGEDALMAALRKTKESGATTIVIAHRPSIVAEVDKLLLLRDGRVEQFGERAAVMARLAAPAAPGRIVNLDRKRDGATGE